jgi:hypothetical protein
LHYDSGYNNGPLAILCHVVYATLGLTRQSNTSVTINQGIAGIHVTQSGVDVPGAMVYLFSENDACLGWFETTKNEAGKVEFLLPDRFLLVFVKFIFELDQRILQRGSQQFFVDGGDVVFFGPKQAVDDIVNHFSIKASLNGDIFVCVDIFRRNQINLVELHPGVFGKEGSARRDKEQTALFNAAGS